MRGLIVLAVAVLVLASAPTAIATPYWSPEMVRAMEEGIQPTAEPTPHEFLSWEPGRYDYMLEYDRVVTFITSLQVMDPGDPDYGGLREAEHMLDVIQTDNTSELIWVLSRYREMTGDTLYDANIQAAWAYEMNFPAYLEEGGEANTTGYYRIYNCGWAIRAEMKYREVFGDTTYLSYGDSCARYLSTHNLILTIDPFYMTVNPTVLAWAAGNLHHYGVERGNPSYLDAAALRGERVKNWANNDSTLLGKQRWAMSGGAVMWGVLNSYFQAHPESAQIWAAAMGPFMDTYSDPGNFQNAWNGWYALGHLAAGQALDDPAYLANHHALTDTLLFEDGDDDGGVPAQPADADTMDHAWIANYLAFMGLDPLLTVTPVALLDPAHAPKVSLEGNWPNPFNPNTNIIFDLPSEGRVSLVVFDVEGRLVRTLVDGTLPEGRRTVPWNGLDDGGRSVSPGVYFSRLRFGEGPPLTGKMVLVK